MIVLIIWLILLWFEDNIFPIIWDILYLYMEDFSYLKIFSLILLLIVYNNSIENIIFLLSIFILLWYEELYFKFDISKATFLSSCSIFFEELILNKKYKNCNICHLYHLETFVYRQIIYSIRNIIISLIY